MLCEITKFKLVVAAALAVLSFSLYSHAQQLSRRLILKDGSYQTVTKYEVKGDRVRYYSAEREEWEELPTSLVDWPATEKFEKDRAATPAVPEAAEIDKDFNADREAEQSHLPQVAPGLRLPELDGMYLLDNFKGQPQLVEVKQDEGDLNRNTKSNIIRGALGPIASAKQTIELEGEHAAINAHVTVPSIYIKLDEDSSPPPGETASAKPSEPSLDAPRAKPEQPQQPEEAVVPYDRFLIVHLKVKNGRRIAGDLKRAASGKTTQEQNSVKTTIDTIGGGWLKLTPTADLAPGEYAVVEMKGSEGMNLYFWPFGVNPNASANPNPWTPDVKDQPKDKDVSEKK